jgi:hypothetical protein
VVWCGVRALVWDGMGWDRDRDRDGDRDRDRDRDRDGDGGSGVRIPAELCVRAPRVWPAARPVADGRLFMRVRACALGGCGGECGDSGSWMRAALLYSDSAESVGFFFRLSCLALPCLALPCLAIPSLLI